MRTILWGLLVMTVVGCSPSLSPYTQNMQKKLNWSEAEMKGIQFYLSDDIVLYREVEMGDATVRDGKIKIRNGRKVEEIFFEEGTPGVYLYSPKRDHVAISFEGGEDRYLVFGPNPKLRGRYVLLAKDWNQQNGKVRYGGKVYLTSTLSSVAGLEVDLDRADKTSIKSRTARGRRVD